MKSKLTKTKTILNALLLISLFCSISWRVQAQSLKEIEGTVMDGSTNTALSNVSVNVKGNSTGRVTDVNGKYNIRAGSADVLIFSSIGFESQEIKVGSRAVINVVLKTSSTNLGEVVVNVGYGAQRKATLTGAIGTLSGKDLQHSPALNIANNMAGQLTGVVTKMSSGEPGRDNPDIFIRGRNTTGDNSPLVVVDGVQGVTGWERINSNDIESISVLKDASAAIYGARAANGVILITTKRGTTGKPVISYSFNQAVNQPTRIPKMANSAEFAGYVNQLNVEAGQPPTYTDAEIQLFRDGSNPAYINTDWYGEVLRKSSYQSQHNLSVRGGTENVKYSVSGSYTNEGSIFKNGSLNYKTYAIRSNLDARISENFKIGFDLNGSLYDGNYPAYSTSATFSALKQIPMVPVFWPNGLPTPGIENGENPGVMGTSLTGNENVKTYNYVTKAYFDLNIPQVKGLGVDGYFAYSNEIGVDKNWQTPWTVYSYDDANNTYIPQLGGGLLSPQLTDSFRQAPMTLLNLRIKYELKTGNHHLSTFVAAEQSDIKYNNFYASRKNYISAAIDELFAGGLVDQSTGGQRSESGRKNLFGRVSYGFMDKYLLDINLRYDGSSNFPKGNQWGFFPGVSVGWRVSQEKFMKNVNFIDNLKLRASIGKMGNDAVAPFQDLTLYTLGNTGASYGSTPVATNGLIAGVTPNPNITWEVATMTNLGLDARLWKGLLGVTVDVFKQSRNNILASRSLNVPVFTGLILPNENIGTVENKGIEIELNHTEVFKDFSFRIGGTFSYSQNKVIYISEAQNVTAWKKLEGHVLGAAQYYHAIGIFRTQAEVDKSPVYPGTRVGDLQYQDIDGDGVITANDMYTSDKTSTPEMVFGLNLSMNYKNFSLWANFAGASNAWQYYYVNARLAINQLEDVIVNRYTPGSMNSKYPRIPTVEAATSGEPDGQPSDYWLRNSTYGRLKTLELSYNLPQKLLSKVKIQSLKIYVNGNNLFTVDNVKWADPENTSPTSDYYPQSKIYNLGINLTF
jgi:TonB-linked SusC/RagA family outer membrane protein